MGGKKRRTITSFFPRWLWGLWLLFATFLLPFPCPGETAGGGITAEVRAFDLPNGLRVLMLERHTSPTVAFYIRHRVGAADEERGKTGTAHLLEHLLFKGTTSIGTRDYKREKRILKAIEASLEALDKERAKGGHADPKRIADYEGRLKRLEAAHRRLFVSNEIDRIYQENGAENLNATTGQDLTTYHVSLPKNRLELWARIESDRMYRPVFREFRQERDVVLEERRQRVDAKPEALLNEAFYRAAFTLHPYGRPVIGLAEDIASLSIRDVRDFFLRTHTPANTVIAVVGSFDPEALKKTVTAYFGSLPHRPPPTASALREPPQTVERRVTIPIDSEPYLLVGFHKPNVPHADDYVFDVIEALLSQGRTSRFFRDLVERSGLARTVEAVNGLPGSRYPNLFVCGAQPRHPHGVEEVERALYEVLDRLKTEPVGEEELKKVKTNIRADLIRRQTSNEGLASLLSYYEALIGDYRYLDAYEGKIEEVTPEDIMRVARTYLTAANRTVAVGIKKREKR
ncbi:MAG TPA: pitrilysin family protein [Syntrophales bacterium]|nr:pitrilysin family protein [Syntrophales bacterium]HOM07374.1 pitrilysin family protein [Syntrophales bacterium]HON98921.1 pitrilysin family protein [Syntrophales bacterium]HPC00385.1 pitrilysin family protein [Syntrophales bacterium]HPQ06988.1 pitrilysin family protein [Syntrophales bacterium]